VILHIGYKLALARTYALGDLGQAYPLARGFVPLFSTVIAFALLDQIPTTGQMLGIAVVSLGLLWLATHSIRDGVDRRLFLVALAAGLTVSGYSIVDAYGTRLNGNWASFTAWLVVVDSFIFGMVVYAMRGAQVWHALWHQRARMLLSGGLGLVSFSVFLWALSRSPIGPVSALRESSVLFSTLIGMAVYDEEKSPHKVGAVALLVAGLILFATAK
jgi:drug/metabolite transporter (DMT)-like permease